jgi:hypothetical protein
LPIVRQNGEEYSKGKAAKISSESLNNAFKKTDTYFKSNPLIRQEILKDFFISTLRTEMGKYGGSISTSTALGYKPKLTDYRYYILFDDPPCWN